MRKLLQFVLTLVVLVHAAAIVGVVASFFVLPFSGTYWYYWLPMEVLIINLVFSRGECPITRFENKIRKSLGYKPIGGFVGHYFKRPVFAAFGKRRRLKMEAKLEPECDFSQP
jgi:hypothetical protein